MVRYETLFLAVPEITKDEAALIEKQLDQKVKAAKGATISFERWGKYKLAYPVRDNDYGVYFLSRFEVSEDKSGELVKELRDLFKLKFTDVVMRDIVSRLTSESLAYVKPESLEEIPTRDVDSFLRENKMEGLLSSVSSKDEDMDEDIDEEDED